MNFSFAVILDYVFLVVDWCVCVCVCVDVCVRQRLLRVQCIIMLSHLLFSIT